MKELSATIRYQSIVTNNVVMNIFTLLLTLNFKICIFPNV